MNEKQLLLELENAVRASVEVFGATPIIEAALNDLDTLRNWQKPLEQLKKEFDEKQIDAFTKD